MERQHSVLRHGPGKRFLLLCIGAALSALVLAGCGGGGGGGGSAGFGGFLPIVPPAQPPSSPPSSPPSVSSFAIGGTASGLAGTVVLRNNDKDDLTLTADGAFVFATRVVAGNPYAVTVAQRPVGQTCAVSAGQGTASASTGDVSDVRVVCAARTYAIGGTVSGLAASGTLVLRNNNNAADELSVTADGSFSFAQALPHGAAFDVTVRTQPVGQLCTLANASGIATAPVTDIVATCVADPASLPPSVPAVPSVGYAPKAFLFSWTAEARATYYRLGEDPANSGTFSVLADNLTGTTYALQNLALAAPPVAYRYALQACNANGCSAWSAPVLPDATQAIGYFKRPADLVGTSSMGQGRSAIAFSPDGLLMAIADVRANAVHLYGNDAGNWRWVQTLVWPESAPGSVSLSDEGTLLAGRFQSGTIQGGQVEVYERGPQGWAHSETWRSPLPRNLGDFGSSVSVSRDGTVAAVSEYGITGAGDFYVYRRTAGQWVLEQRIDAPSGEGGSLFGAFATISQDGATIAVGAQYENSAGGLADAGAAYVYTKAAGAGGWTLNTRFEQPVQSLNAWFGGSVAMSGNGEVVIVGASREDDAGYTVAGALYVYRRVGAGYQLEQRISAPFPQVEARFGGYGTSVSGDGSLIAVASFRDGAASAGVNGDMTPAGTSSGAVMLYEKRASGWTLKSFVKAPNPGSGDTFGYGLTLSADGKTLAVGAIGEASNATGIGGNQADNSVPSAGAVYLY